LVKAGESAYGMIILRLGWLEMENQELIVYGTNWCGDCIRIRRFLHNNGIEYRWVNIDQDKEGERLVMWINRGMRSVPTIILPDGDVLVEPSAGELKFKLRSLAE
jgi:mycoredoxin